MAREFVEVDPATLHLPGARRDGADPLKLQRQVDRHGSSLVGMPPSEVVRGSDGALMLMDGVTRATRAAKLAPGQLIRVEVTAELRAPVGSAPTVGERL